MDANGNGNDSKLRVDAGYEQLLQSGSTDYEFPDLDENTKATTFYTTGTTGNPKGVYFSHRQLMLHTLGVSRFRSNDVYMPLTPMFHVHAWGFPYVATLLGAKQVYPGRYEPERLLKLIETEGVTYSHCVPTILQMLLSCPTINQVDLSNWKVTIGGARLPRGQARAAKDLGIEIHAGYGMSRWRICSIGKTTPCWTSSSKPDGRCRWWNLRFLTRRTRRCRMTGNQAVKW
jgi:fatty-acyl-CoA synthase